MRKVAEILIVEDFTGRNNPQDPQIHEIISSLKDVDAITVTRIHIPEWSEDSEGLAGVHLVVREVAET
ncbi:hypothetical protein [Metallosphaera hakonensis]|uniref:Uncharacterized protein n=1 Tax=Metallosphaera hakonensis JCM 8857 = DSM 7519 TaxID=1293036 RepID=A0A2U9IVF4_9CREN|nr:hypothetical protein [Metallosphaera hakonensis]AWR99974.1 hypothetical protein DFR87_10100 [Metallosphaera hakonensis JCM 8857 = DSM 7519]